MTLLLTEAQVKGLLDMKEVVRAVDEVFRQQGLGATANSPRTRSRAPGAVLSVMHASLPYLGRAGLKCYLSSPQGTRFVAVLFDLEGGGPLAVMGADHLGRYRTGAMSAVATRHLYRQRSARLALFGSGRQALTQVLALAEVLTLESVKVWSPDPSHRRDFVAGLTAKGINAAAAESPGSASRDSDVGSTITSAPSPFLEPADVAPLSHLNACGGNNPGHAELTPQAIGAFDQVFVDDLAQARVEYGDLLGAASAGAFRWESARELGAAVAGAAPEGKTLFKSGGVAMADVAVANLVYEKALRGGSEDFSFG